LKLSSIDSEEKAKGLLKATILIEEKLIPTLIDEDPDSKMEGYAVVDKVHGELGRVSYVGGNEVNPLLVIEKDGYELIIPLNDEFVLSVDDEKHLIEVSTPEGLLDLNS
jgi:16S rRNA processing protein RimM